MTMFDQVLCFNTKHEKVFFASVRCHRTSYHQIKKMLERQFIDSPLVWTVFVAKVTSNWGEIKNTTWHSAKQVCDQILKVRWFPGSKNRIFDSDIQETTIKRRNENEPDSLNFGFKFAVATEMRSSFLRRVFVDNFLDKIYEQLKGWIHNIARFFIKNIKDVRSKPILRLDWRSIPDRPG